MTEDPHERKPLVWRQDLGNIHLSLNPSVETAQVTAEQKRMARKIDLRGPGPGRAAGGAASPDIG